MSRTPSKEEGNQSNLMIPLYTRLIYTRLKYHMYLDQYNESWSYLLPYQSLLGCMVVLGSVLVS